MEIESNPEGYGTMEGDLDALYAEWRNDRASAEPTSLRRWIEQYPQFRADLTHWTCETSMFDAAAAIRDDTGLEARVLEIGMRQLSLRQQRRQGARTPQLTGLYAGARLHGLTPKLLAAALGLGMPVIAKLEQRLFRLESLPARLIARLAELLRVEPGQVREYLTLSATLAPSAQYKADRAPQAGAQEDFAQAVRNCPDMTMEQKQEWLEAAQE